MDEINLKQIITEFPDCITNGAKLKAILLDTYPEISKAIVNTLVIMANSGIAKEIQDSKNVTELDKSRWQKKLEDDYGLSENTICSCLNVIFTSFDLNDIYIARDTKPINKSLISKQCQKDLTATDLTDFETKDSLLITYKGSAEEVVVPDGITAIGAKAFDHNYSIKKIILSNSITELFPYAFAYCDNLFALDLSNNLTRIGTGVFFCCKSIETIVIPKGITSISECAFFGCKSLSKIYIGKNIRKICEKAFFNCNKLYSVSFNGTLSQWENIDKENGWNFNCGIKEIVCNDGVVKC